MFAPENKKYQPLMLVSLLVLGVSLGSLCSHTIPEELSPSMGDYMIHMLLSIFFFINLRVLYLTSALPMALNYFTMIERDHKVAMRIVHNAYVLFTHTIFGLWFVYSLPRRPWFGSYAGVWEYFPDQLQERSDVILYILKVGYHTTSLSLIAYEPHRDDYVLTIIHHVVTLFLILCSFQLNYIRIGLLVLLYHDITDGAVSLPKMCNYLKQKSLAIVSVVMMIILWATFRLYLFGALIIRSVVSYRYFIRTPSQWGCLISLSVLWAMHLFWFYLMCQIVSGVIMSKGKMLVDVSENSGDAASTANPHRGNDAPNGVHLYDSKITKETMEMKEISIDVSERQRLTQ